MIKGFMQIEYWYTLSISIKKYSSVPYSGLIFVLLSFLLLFILSELEIFQISHCRDYRQRHSYFFVPYSLESLVTCCMKLTPSTSASLVLEDRIALPTKTANGSQRQPAARV